MKRAACLGECMIELREEPDGRFSRSFGGDTLNTAVYLARLGTATDYITALGDDSWSDELLSAWIAEGVGTDRVLRIPGHLPGLYVIQTDAKGERSFSYWRDSAAARLFFQVPYNKLASEDFASYDLLYFSGITLSLYDDEARHRLFTVLSHARAAGTRIAFDTNFRSRGWPDSNAAQAAFRQAFEHASVILASTEDLELLFGESGVAELLNISTKAEVVLKHPDLTCRLFYGGEETVVKGQVADDVVDTTAAGDSFAAAYLAARLSGGDLEASAKAGHRLARQVVRFRGAIIPQDAMPG